MQKDFANFFLLRSHIIQYEKWNTKFYFIALAFIISLQYANCLVLPQKQVFIIYEIIKLMCWQFFI